MGAPGDMLVADDDAETARSALVSIAVLTLLTFEVGSLSVTPGAGSTRELAVTLEEEAGEKLPVIVSVTRPRCGSAGNDTRNCAVADVQGAGQAPRMRGSKSP